MTFLVSRQLAACADKEAMRNIKEDFSCAPDLRDDASSHSGAMTYDAS